MLSFDQCIRDILHDFVFIDARLYISNVYRNHNLTINIKLQIKPSFKILRLIKCMHICIRIYMCVYR